MTEVKMVDENGAEYGVTVPSGFQTGIKVNVNCDVLPGGASALLLDFNAYHSIHQTGGGVYMLQPVIPAVVKVLSGTIVGTVTMDGTTPVAGAKVDVYAADGTWANGTVTADGSVATAAAGTFKVWALEAGTYNLVVTYTNEADGSVWTASVPGVVVSANQDMSVNTLTLAPAPTPP
jgi:hypothetical protein